MNGESIKERRAALGMSQSQFATALGVSVRTLQNWEQGHRTHIRLANLIDYAISEIERKSKKRPLTS